MLALATGKMDKKYRLVEEKYIGAHGFIDDIRDVSAAPPNDASEGFETQSIVRITQQAKPRSCITTAMNMLVSCKSLRWMHASQDHSAPHIV